MITQEKAGTYIVSFDKISNGRVVGRIDGDDTPVFVHKDSLPAKLGERWSCSLMVNTGAGGINYFAILQERLDDDESLPSEEEGIEHPAAMTAEDDIEGERYVIDDDDSPAAVPEVIRTKWRKVVCYIGKDTLYSDLLEEGAYMAYSSLSKTVIQLIPSRCGDLYCHSGIMQIDGLDEIVGAYSECLLPHSQKNGTLLVYLD